MIELPYAEETMVTC